MLIDLLFVQLYHFTEAKEVKHPIQSPVVDFNSGNMGTLTEQCLLVMD